MKNAVICIHGVLRCDISRISIAQKELFVTWNRAITISCYKNSPNPLFSVHRTRLKYRFIFTFNSVNKRLQRSGSGGCTDRWPFPQSILFIGSIIRNVCYTYRTHGYLVIVVVGFLLCITVYCMIQSYGISLIPRASWNV